MPDFNITVIDYAVAVGFWFLPFYHRRSQVYTTPEFLERRFDRRSWWLSRDV